jgi:hypothetical protein
MALPIRNVFELAEQLDAIRQIPPARRPLLGFFLFDERHSHEVVLEFARREYEWLDALASANQMCLFFFLPEANLVEYVNADDSIFVGEPGRIARNPSLEVALAFALGPDELPGVIFFTDLDLTTHRTHEGVYWPLSAELFVDDAGGAEARLSEMFGAVQQARAESGDLDSLLVALRKAAEAEGAMKPAGPERLRLPQGLKPVVSRGVLIEVANMAVVQGLGI